MAAAILASIVRAKSQSFLYFFPFSMTSTTLAAQKKRLCDLNAEDKVGPRGERSRLNQRSLGQTGLGSRGENPLGLGGEDAQD